MKVSILILVILLVNSFAFGQKREVAVTFDDLPAPFGNLETLKYVTKHLLTSIKANNVPAIGFVNEIKLYRRGEIDDRVALLQMWLDAGFELGNHTFSHPNFNDMPLDEYEENIIRGETVTQMLLAEKNKKLKYLRHPFLHTGDTLEKKESLARFLAARGYIVAPVTLDNNDYIFAFVYAKAKERGDKETMKRVSDAYIPYMESIFDFFEKLSVETVGYEVKQTLLLHANELNADYFDKLVQMMKNRNYTFITLDEALKDKAYKLAEAPDKKGLSWIRRWRAAKGLPVKSEPDEPKFVTDLYNDLIKAQR
jgi:peptidoglycan-N-acetylglucosamine deacetylase